MMLRRRHALLLGAAAFAGFAAPSPAAVPGGPFRLAIAKRGWHTEIGIPNAALNGPLASLGPAVLHRNYLLIGYGARKYFTNPHAGAGTAAEALLPGPAAINLAAFNNVEDDTSDITWLNVSQANINGLLAFVWNALPRPGNAPPAPIVITNNASIFYAATPDYNMLYNCNNWAVDALRAAGLPFTNAGLHYAADVQAQAQRIAAAQTS